MKVTLVGLLAFAGLSAAQNCIQLAITGVPRCAQSCLQSAGAAVGSCGLIDFACQCENSGPIATAAAQCVVSACGAESAALVPAAGSSVCKCASSAGLAGSSSRPASNGATPTDSASGSSGSAAAGSGSGSGSAATQSKESINTAGSTGAGPTATIGLSGIAVGVLGLAAFL